jgi:hypothetical protein
MADLASSRLGPKSVFARMSRREVSSWLTVPSAIVLKRI